MKKSLYRRARESFREFALGVVFPKRVLALSFSKKHVLERVGYSLDNVYAHVHAAERLGYESVLSIEKVTENLVLHFVTKRPDTLPEYARKMSEVKQ
jgi:hypothetical protein